MSGRQTIDRHRWVVAVAIPSGRPDLRDLAEALRSLPGRRVVRAEAWVEDAADVSRAA